MPVERVSPGWVKTGHVEELTAAHFRSRACIYFKGKNGQLRACTPTVSAMILGELLRGDSKSVSSLNTFCWSTYSKYCDLGRMKLLNPIKEEKEDILIEFPWDPKSLIAIIAQKRDRTLERQVLLMALDRIRREPNLRKILTMKGLPTCEIRENPYLCPGHTPYDNFVESLLDIFENQTIAGSRKPTLFEHFLESAADNAGDENFASMEQGGIRTVFHGTSHKVMEAILLSGLDPKCRSERCEGKDFFGITFSKSLKYTKGYTNLSRKLLVFMVLNLQKDDRYSNEGTVVSNRLELPLAEITIDLDFDSDE